MRCFRIGTYLNQASFARIVTSCFGALPSGGRLTFSSAIREEYRGRRAYLQAPTGTHVLSMNDSGAPLGRKLVLIAIGTLGDLDPLLAVGSALRARGHYIAVGTSDNLCDRVKQLDFEVHPLCGDLSDITVNPLRAILSLKASLSSQLRTVAKLAEGASAILGSGFPYAAPTIAEQRGVPYVYAVVSPTYVPESGLLPYIGTAAPFWMARFGWWYQAVSSNLLFRKNLNAFRSEAGMQPAGSVFQDVFQPARRILAAPRVLSGRIPDAKGVFVSGFLQLPVEGRLPESVERFFEDGPAPLVVALGSSRIPKARELVLNIVAAAGKHGLRTLVASSWSDREIGDLPASVGRSPAVPYCLLFQRAAALVHHGGAGTFAAALASGKPQVTMPGFADQSYWARKAFEIGVAPAPIPRAKATAARISKGISDVCTCPSYASRAKEICETEISTNGAAAAARWLESIVN